MRNLYQHIQDTLHVEVKQACPLSGGCIGEVYLLDLADGRRAVAKVDSGPKQRLDVEGMMLRYLREHSSLPVPEVFHAAPGLLVMEYIAGESQFSAESEAHAAELLAALHAVRAEQFGFGQPTLIGALHQPNTWHGSWIDFFRGERLLYMSEEALREGKMPQAMFRRIKTLSDHLEEFLEEPAHPSLIHGDAWTTNILAREGRITAFLDPALYYGHPEIELAFTTLFCTFGQAFFQRYQEVRGIQDGFFEVRKDIYNLYPLLVHARLFGSSYLSSVDRTLDRLGF